MAYNDPLYEDEGKQADFIGQSHLLEYLQNECLDHLLGRWVLALDQRKFGVVVVSNQ